MHPRLNHDDGDSSHLRVMAYAHAVAAMDDLADRPESGVRRTGALQIPSPNFPVERLEAVADRYRPAGLGVRLVDRQTAGALIGAPELDLPPTALWFPDACTVDTPGLTRHLLNHPAIEVACGSALDDWPEGPTVLACGMGARQFPGAAFLELGVVSGQLDRVARGTGQLQGLRAPITGRGYLAPMSDGTIGVGATYEYEPWPPAQATEANFRHLTRLAADWHSPDYGCRPIDHYRASRCVSSDRTPVVGALVDLGEEDYVDRFVSIGHGSMGTVTTHLAASLIEAALIGSVRPLTDPLLALVSPRRFRLRQARRGYRFGAAP